MSVPCDPRRHPREHKPQGLLDPSWRCRVSQPDAETIERLCASVCPSTPDALSARLSEHPALGMPYGLPALGEQAFTTLEAWIAAGAPGTSAEQLQKAPTVSDATAVAAWEAFFNSPDKRQQLVARYIFEHVFLATITLEESPGDRFRLVRSTTPPPKLVTGEDGAASLETGPIKVIATDLPYDDPYSYAGVARFWYRLEKITEPPVQKNLWLWRLGLDDIEHLAELFLSRERAPDADLDPQCGTRRRLCHHPSLSQRGQ